MTKYKIKTHFEGYINDIKFDNENIYKIVYEVLEKINYDIDECYNDKFIEDLQECLKKASLDDKFSFIEAKNKLIEDLENEEINKFEDIQFTLPYVDSVFNKKLENGEYSHHIYECDYCRKWLQTGDEYYAIGNIDVSTDLAYDNRNIYCSKSCILEQLKIEEGTLK